MDAAPAWYVIAAVFAPASMQADQRVTIADTTFGARQHLICKWFSNFENSRFERCRIAGGAALPLEDGAALQCVEKACDQLDTAARSAMRWTKPEPVWSTFTVELYGRVSTVRREKRYLGDATRVRTR